MTVLSNFRETYPDPNRILADDLLDAMGSDLDPYELSDFDVALLVDSVWGDIMARAGGFRP